jgi:hypothetical protein
MMTKNGQRIKMEMDIEGLLPKAKTESTSDTITSNNPPTNPILSKTMANDEKVNGRGHCPAMMTNDRNGRRGRELRLHLY